MTNHNKSGSQNAGILNADSLFIDAWRCETLWCAVICTPILFSQATEILRTACSGADILVTGNEGRSSCPWHSNASVRKARMLSLT